MHPKKTLSREKIMDKSNSHNSALKGRIEKLRDQAIRISPVIIWVLDNSGAFRYSEGGVLGPLELSHDALLGTNVFEVYSGFPELLGLIERGLAGEEFIDEIRLERRLFRMQLYPTKNSDDDIDGLELISREISEHETAASQNDNTLIVQKSSHKFEHDQFIRKKNDVLLQLALSEQVHQADLKKSLEIICTKAGNFLQVARTGIWIYNDDSSAILCLNLFERDYDRHSEGATLRASEYPAYFEALAHERAIDAHDAHSDPRTRDFSRDYLAPLGITSMLDAPIRSGGRMIGVICHEHVGPQRTWRLDELGFAGSIGDLVATILATDERRKMEHQLFQAQKLESVGLLAGGIAHDFNNLLTSILGGASNLLNDIPTEHKSRPNLENVVLAAQRASELTRQLLAYSGKASYEKKTIDIARLVRESHTLIATVIPPHVDLTVELPNETLNIEADEIQIQQVLMNIIINGAEAIGEEHGWVTVTGGIEKVTETMLAESSGYAHLPAGDYVYIDISDNGAGMDEKTQAKIYDPFFSTKFSGRGLGLAAVVGITKAHDGFVQVTSEIDKGTTFRAYFPASSHSITPHQEIPDSYSGAGQVLLVDDDHTIRQVVRYMLENFGYEVLEAENGEQGLQLAQERAQTIDLIILDLAMPVMGGNEAYRRIRNRDRRVPIIMTSGFDETEATSTGSTDESTWFLQKPFTAKGLAEKLRTILGPAQPKR